MLVQRYAALQARLRDQQLGYAPHRGPRIHTDFQLGQYLFELLDQMSTLVSQVEELMLSPAFIRMFGDPTDEDTADAEAIMHAAHRLMNLHERLLSLTERCRGGTVAMDPVLLEMADNDRLLDKAFAGLATLAPHAH